MVIFHSYISLPEGSWIAISGPTVDIYIYILWKSNLAMDTKIVIYPITIPFTSDFPVRCLITRGYYLNPLYHYIPIFGEFGGKYSLLLEPVPTQSFPALPTSTASASTPAGSSLRTWSLGRPIFRSIQLSSRKNPWPEQPNRSLRIISSSTFAAMGRSKYMYLVVHEISGSLSDW